MATIAKLQPAPIVVEYINPTSISGWNIFATIHNGESWGGQMTRVLLDPTRRYLLEVLSSNAPLTRFRQNITAVGSRDVTLDSGQTAVIIDPANDIGGLSNSAITHAVVKLTPL